MLQITSLRNLLSQLIADEMEEKQSCSFVYAGIAFCKLQHLVLTIPVKNQAVLFNEKSETLDVSASLIILVFLLLIDFS